MKRSIVALLLVCAALTLSGCGSSSSSQQTIVTDILSDATYDGDIRQDASGGLTVTQGNTQSVFAGINPTTGAEYRAFLDFPLTGFNGVPGNAVIVSATLDFVVNSIQPQPLPGLLPIRIDLVSFQPPNLLAGDYDRTTQPALATVTIAPPISQADFGHHVAVDVTGLMWEVQRLGLPDFQVRILLDLGTSSQGLLEIDDTTGPNRRLLAPILSVEYI